MKKKYLIPLVTIVGLLIVSFGFLASYALWYVTANQNESNIVQSGCFEITFENINSSISLQNSYPMSIYEASQMSPYIFKIKNTCSITSKYNVNVNSQTTSTLNDSQVRVSVLPFELFGAGDILSSLEKNPELSGIAQANLRDSYIVESGYLLPNEELTYAAYVWMDESVGNEGMNATFEAQISIFSIATANFSTLKKADAGEDNSYFLDGPLLRSEISSVQFITSKEVPSDVGGLNVRGSWDVSHAQDGSIMAYYTINEESKGETIVYIGQDGGVIANQDSSNLCRYVGCSYFENLDTSKVKSMRRMHPNVFGIDFNTSSVYDMSDMGLGGINGTVNIDTSKVVSMRNLFKREGYSQSYGQLILGEKFDTSRVVDMNSMFSNAAGGTIELGPNFNTENVIDMGYMFYIINPKVFNLGSKFDTSQVVNMEYMFTTTRMDNLDLGDKFNTSKVTNMSHMFDDVGFGNTTFTLILGNQFDTSNVTDMSYMFSEPGRGATTVNLSLGEKFNTSKVTNMSHMFYNMAYNDPNFTFSLGDKFITSNVTNMEAMFSNIAKASTVFTLDLGNDFDTSKVTNMSSMFTSAGHNAPNFSLDLGNKFNTSNVTDMSKMFSVTGFYSTTFSLNLGILFDTSKVTNMENMFFSLGRSNANFVLDFGPKFNTSAVTNISNMFNGTAYQNTNFKLDLRAFDFSSVTNSVSAFYTSRATHTIYTKNASDAAFVSGTGYTGIVKDCSATSCP